MRHLLFKNLVILYLAGFLTTVPQIFAENESKIEDIAENENVKFSETTISSNNSDINSENNSDNNSENISYKKKIIKSIKETITPYREQIRRENRLNKRVNNPSLKVIIKEIYGDEGNRSAVIEFEGKEITVIKDQIVDGKFKVIDIYPDRMVVFSNSEQRRHTYKIINNNEADISKEKLESRPKMTNPIKKPERNDPIPPLKVVVKGIVGDEEKRSAVIEFEEKEITVVKDQVVDGKFKVIDIYPDRLVVYSFKELRRHTYKLNKEGN